MPDYPSPREFGLPHPLTNQARHGILEAPRRTYTGRFVLKAAETQSGIVGRAPFTNGLTSRCTSRQRRRVRGGRFIMQLALGLDLFIDDDFGNWLAGFVDGEGSFQIGAMRRRDRYIRKDGTSQESHECNLLFQIKLRIDDIDTLIEIKNKLGCGDIEISFRQDARKNFKNAYPSAIYIVRSYADLKHIIVPLFEKYPLRAKKRRDFELWKKAVDIAYISKKSRCRAKAGKRALSDELWEEFERLDREIKEVRKPKELTLYLNKIPMSKWDKYMRSTYGNS